MARVAALAVSSRAPAAASALWQNASSVTAGMRTPESTPAGAASPLTARPRSLLKRRLYTLDANCIRWQAELEHGKLNSGPSGRTFGSRSRGNRERRRRAGEAGACEE